MSSFTPGNIVVYRVGDGTAALSSAATAVFLDEYTPTGVLVQSVALPSLADNGANQILTASGTAGSEGLLTISADGRFILLTGYDTAAGTASVANSVPVANLTGSSNERVVGRVGIDGVIDTSTTFGTTVGGNSNNIRGAASVDGSQIYESGPQGVYLQTFGMTGAPTAIETGTNARSIEIVSGQLYLSSGSGTNTFKGVDTVGTGLPTTGPATVTRLAGLTDALTPSSYSYVFADLSATVAGVDTLYVVDTTTANSLQKFSLVGGTWTFNGKITTATNFNTAAVTVSGVTGLTGSVSGTTVTLFASDPSNLFSVVDTGGYNTAFSATTLTTIAAATTNEGFRGVAFAPTGTIAIDPSTASVTHNEGNTGSTAYSFLLTRTGGTATAANVAYTVTGTGGNPADAADFGGTLPSGIATFAAGSATTTVTVNVSGDTAVEPTETFAFTLTTADPGYTVSATANTATGTITNDDAGLGTLSVSSSSVNEGNSGTTALTFTITSTTAAPAGGITFTYATSDGTATAPGDYTALTGNGTIAAGATQTTVTVLVNGDTTAEPDETLTLTINNTANTATATAQGTGTILNDDTVDTTPPTLTTSTPVDNAVDVAIGANLVLTFNEAVKAGTGNIILRPATGADVTIAVTDTAQVSFTGTTATINPTADLRPGVAYDVILASGVITDTAGNAFAGIVLDALDFTTSFAIPGGAQATSFTVADPGTFTLAAGVTRQQTAAVGVNIAAAGVTVDIEGRLNGPLSPITSGQTARAIDAATTVGNDTLVIGAAGVVQTTNNDAVRFRTVNPASPFTVTNSGQILVLNNAAAPSNTGGTPGDPINNGHGLVLTAVQGATGAAATDYVSGATITNGSAGNTAALIRSSAGDAVRLGSHQTLVNYGTIDGNGPVNDVATNNSFRTAPNNTTTNTYSVSRGVRIDDDGAANSNQGKSDRIDNYGTIAGSQHGVDFGDPDSANSVVVNEIGGLIVGHNGSGIGADTIGTAATTITVQNSGTIRGERATTVVDRAGYTYSNAAGSTNPGDSDGDGVDIDGGGTVLNYAGASIVGAGASGYDAGGHRNVSEGISIGGGVITNFGAISGADAGITANNDSNAGRSGVIGTTITNYVAGSIVGQANYAIRLENKTGTAAADNDSITNYGAITGNAQVPTGTVMLQNGAADPGAVGTLDGVTYTTADAGNARFLQGDGAAIQTGEGVDTLANYGTITGNVSGRAINLEGGDDALTLYTGSTVTGRIDGGAGSDTLTLALDNRATTGAAATTGNNSGVTTGTLANVINVETLAVASGAWTIADAQGYSAGTTIANGATLTLATGAALTGAIADNGILAVTSTGAITLAGTISGTGVVQQAGSGTLTLSGANSYSGGTTLTAGTLDVAALGGAGTGAIAFTGGVQTLRVEQAALNGGVFGNTITGYAADGDAIDVRGIGTATASYNATSGVLTLTGSSTAALTIGTGYGAFLFNAAADGAGGTAVTIAPSTPATLSIGTASVVEGNSGLQNLIFTVTASAAAPASGISFTATTADGTATAGSDYTATTGSYMIAPGQTSTTVFVPVTGDTRIEPDETLTLTLSNPANATIATATGTGTITNDDFPSLTITGTSVAEGDSGTSVLTFTVTASAPAPAPISFTVATSDGTATAGSDYVMRAAAGTIAAGATSYSFAVTVNGDTSYERNETVMATLSGATNATIATASSTGTITNDDPLPQNYHLFDTNFTGFTAAGFAPTAPAGGLSSNIWRVVGLSDNTNPAYGFTGPSGGDFGRGVIDTNDPTTAGVYSSSTNAALIVQPTGTELDVNGAIEARIQNTSGANATSFAVGFDWVYRNSATRADNLVLAYSTDGATFTQAPASAFSTPDAFTAPIGNVFTHVPETVTLSNLIVADGGYLYLRWVHLSSTGGGSRDEVGIDNVTIDAALSNAPALTIGGTNVTEGNTGTTAAVFTLHRTSATGAGSIDYRTTDGSATSTSDYAATRGTVTFADGESDKTVTINVNGDTLRESDETFYLDLSNPMGFAAPVTRATATIVNDDTTGPVAIYTIQGVGHTSPFVGQIVPTSGVITGFDANGFYLQDPTGDGDVNTSDALYVFVGAGSTATTTYAVGNAITLSGTVTEFRSGTGGLTITELNTPTAITVTNPAAALPAATVIATDGIAGHRAPPTEITDNDNFATYDPGQDAIDFYESLEGMLVTYTTPLAVSNTNAQHQTYIVASNGVGATGLNDRNGVTITGTDTQPERLELYEVNAGANAHTQGDTLNDVTGILTYFGGEYELVPTGTVTTQTDRPQLARETTALVGDATHLSYASFNLENLAPVPDSTVDARNTQAKVDAAFATHAGEIVNALKNPDIIGLQEVQDADGIGTGTDHSGTATANKLIAAIQAAGGPTYSYVEVAPTDGQSTGGEPNGYIHNGFLYLANRVSVVPGSVRLLDDPVYSGSRRPLLVDFTFNGKTITAVDLHSLSRGGSDPQFGQDQPPVQAGDATRTSEAQTLANYINGVVANDPTHLFVVNGDFNGYPYENALQSLVAGGALTNLYGKLPTSEQYSYFFDGYYQAFDNILVSSSLNGGAAFDIVHYNAGYTDGLSATDHDQAVATITIPLPNTPPTNITLSNSSVAENAPAGTLVGTALTTDAEGGAFLYALTDSAGGRFAIGTTTGQLSITQALDYETTPGASVTIMVTDNGGLTFSKTFAIAVVDVNEAPTTLALAGATVAENAAAGTVVGTLAGTDPDANQTLRYSLVDDGGGRFVVDPVTGKLTTTQPLDYEAMRSVNVIARVSDQGGLTLDKPFTIAVTDVNEAPTRLALSGGAVAENAAAGTLVGTASASDPEGGALRYSLVANPGGLFAIDATTGRLTTTAPLDYEAAASRPVTVRATDTGGLFLDAAFAIAVSDVNEAPTAVALTGTQVTENAAAGTVVGILSATDQDRNETFTYAVSDARFRVTGNQLVVAAGAVIDYETAQSIPLTITATDHGGLSTSAAVTLAVQDVAEPVTGTAGNDTITGGPGADIIDAGAGDDIVNGGPGADRITLGAGADTVRGLLSDLLGDTITDFAREDRIVVQRSDLHRTDLTVSGTGAATVVNLPGGTLALTAGLAGGDLMVAHSGTDSIVTFTSYLAALSEGKAVDATAINGIVNQGYLTGDTSTTFTVRVEAISGAQYDNTLGVYQIDTTTGAISDVRIIAGNVKGAGLLSVTGVTAGHQLGFFIVQDGAHTLSSAVQTSTGLSLINSGGHLVLADHGTAVGGATTFFSTSAAANVDGASHVLSGVAADGSGDLRIGFEDLLRSGNSDNDFQDVVLTVEAVPQAHAVADLPHVQPIADILVLHA